MKALLNRFDTRGIILVQKLPDSVRSLMHAASFVGQPVVTIGIVILIASIGVLQHDNALLAAGSGGLAVICVGNLLKLTLRRTRPDSEYVKAMRYATFSFPSGHTLGTTVAFGLLGLVANGIDPVTMWWLWAADIAIIILVGLSRIYLGAHFPSDVIAGWTIGIVGLFAIVSLAGPLL